MNILTEWATGLRTEQLFLGSALVALGLTALMAALVAAWRMRRRRAESAPAPAVEAAPAPENVVVSLEAAVRNAAAEQTRRLSHELALMDQRLEEMEELVSTLSRRLEETPAPPTVARPVAPPRPMPQRAAAAQPSPEQQALRALAGRA